MKFFNIDQHISVIEDLRHLFPELGHTVEDWSISSHTWVFNRTRTNIPLLEDGNWRQIIKKRLWNDFYTQYRDPLRPYDAFIASYSPVFSMLYQKFEKPILIFVPIRYEHPFSFDRRDWKKFNRFLRKGIDNGRLILAANNLYDKYYCEYFLEREVRHVPSLCAYHGVHYAPEREEYLLLGRYIPEGLHPCIQSREKALPVRHDIHDITRFRGLIHWPYQVSFMSLFEQYSMNLPMFFPSPDFLTELYRDGVPVLKEISWNLYFDRKPGSAIRGSGPWDPNDYRNLRSVAYWLKYADYYDVNTMPFLQYFHSIRHLNQLVETCNTAVVSEQMRGFNRIRKKKILDSWESILKPFTR
ncbi:MAG: hypothetical protein V1913_03470 [Fibrobacterota bacterium]